MREQAGQTGTTRLEDGGFTLVHNETFQLSKVFYCPSFLSTQNQSEGWTKIIVLVLVIPML